MDRRGGPSTMRARALWTSVVAALAALAIATAPPAHAQEGEPSLVPAEAPTAPVAPEPTLLDRVDGAFGDYVVGPLATVLFFDIAFWDDAEEGITLPFIVVWLILGATFFTLRLGFINLRGLKHAVEITAGKYDDATEEGEVTHFQALASALSATVGLGNIAGVALAVSTGGPGAVFWMIAAGFLGMSSKFTECTLGQMYREVDERGRVLGGPMRYLGEGLRVMGLGPLGKVLAVLFAVMCIGGSFGGGNMFQANQAYVQTARVLPFFEGKELLFGIVMAVLVGAVIIGGIKRIGNVAGAIVPFMCGVYLLAGVAVLITHAGDVPAAFGRIVSEAFTPQGMVGGAVGVLITGFKRAAFSNEAGIGSASIAHSAASTNEPVREGLVALLEPFIDTIIICTMTGLVVVVTGEYLNVPPDADEQIRGVSMTSNAFASVFPWFPYVLAVAVFLFAFSTMISWSYYGERCWVFLFGKRSSMVYRVVFLGFVVLGTVLKLGNVVTFSDLMILGMAFPNILGLFLLSGQVSRKLADYWSRYRNGDMPPPSKARPAS